MAPPPAGLGRGERAPDFVLPLQDGTPTRFYARAGGTPAVLVFWPADHTPLLLHFTTTLGHLAARPLALFAVHCGLPAAAPHPPFPVLSPSQPPSPPPYRRSQP